MSTCVVNMIEYNMPFRGPYKQYKVDTSVAVPKSAFYDRRKRLFAEVDDDNAETNLDNIEDQAYPVTDEEYIDGSDFQVRLNAFIKV